MISAEVAIVGAGPGGAWAAYSLAQRGARVLLIDPSHPREKPCGGGVTGRALALLGGLVDAERLSQSVIRSARFLDSATGQSASVTLEAPAPAPANALIVASRAELDSALVAKARDAGAEILAARVRDVVISGGSRTSGCGFRIETVAGTRHAARLIGADGANSLVRRRLAQAFTRGQLSLATGYFAHGVTSDEIVIELLADPAGYVWSFPRPTHLAIGVCAEAAAGVTAETLRARVSEWIRSTAVAPGARLEPYSWPIPSLGQRDFDRLAVSGPGWCLVGDAAGLVDPITREGIYFALLSGQWAAEALASDGSDWWRGYAQRVRDEIASELARAARCKTEFFHPRFTRTLMHGLRHSAKIRAVMADLVAGRQGYAGLKWRLLETLEVGLALKLARSYFAR